MTGCDIAIIGAGPYGISASAHLRTIKGLDVHTFGEPMVFWQRNMPKGMLLRSGWEASHIADPKQSLTLDIFRKESRNHFSSPVPLDRFVNYGLWHQQHSVPDLDRRKIVTVEPGARGFRLILEDGESILANRVVIAAGISSFTWRPPEFDNVPPALATHTSEHVDFEKFAGKEVLVIGGGQSALESAALLHESGATVEIVARAHQIRWLGGIVSRTIHRGFGSKISKLLYAPTDVGPAGISQNRGTAGSGAALLAADSGLAPEEIDPAGWRAMVGGASQRRANAPWTHSSVRHIEWRARQSAPR